LLILAAIASFIPYAPAVEAARRNGFTDEVIQTGLTRSAESRLLFWAAQFAQIFFIYWIGLSETGSRLAGFWLARTHSRVWLTALITVAWLCLCRELLLFPFRVMSYFQSQRWGMLAADYSLLNWSKDYLFASSIDFLLLLVGFSLFWMLIKFLPKFWWLVAPLASGALAISYAMMAPLILDPIMNRFVPIENTEWRDLKPRLLALAARADLPVQDIWVMDASRRSTHSNAYFTGFGSTRRIVLYDTLLKQLSPAEIEAVLAHEIGHWEFDCILSSSLHQHPWRANAKHDPRLLGWIALLLFFGEWIVKPIENNISRRFEIQADIRALELIEDSQVVIDCEKKMAIENKSNVAPSPWNRWLFSTHPSSVQRIETARNWNP
jgi:STE24 endopeptidase